MENIRTNKTFGQLTRFYHLLGIWQSDAESTFSKTGKKLFHMFYSILFQIFLVTCAWQSESKNELFFLIVIEIFVFVVEIKLFYLLYEKDAILAFLYDPIVSHATVVDHDTVADQVNRKTKQFVKFVHSYHFMLWATYFFYIFSTLPIYTNERKLPLFISFKWPVGKHSEILYWIEYCFVLSELAVGFASVSTNVIIWYIMLNYSLEYISLGEKFRHLGVNEMTERNLPATTLKLFHRSCVVLIESHQNVYW